MVLLKYDYFFIAITPQKNISNKFFKASNNGLSKESQLGIYFLYIGLYLQHFLNLIILILALN